MQEQFKKSFCGSNDPCGSTRCVDIYRDGPDGSWPASNDDDDDDDDGHLRLLTGAFVREIGVAQWGLGGALSLVTPDNKFSKIFF